MTELHLTNTALLPVYTFCSEPAIQFDNIAAGAQEMCSFIFWKANLSKWKATTDRTYKNPSLL